ncbi:hypothetical protein L3556_00855 [Candidatus Synechococcus calcipolaris G9]|uniref:Uncharacterized protein n=1 Tax=Candidatus Synechococcus calcipolaris G9 TaxID=1497997 RepID=A0ABT6EUD2_9SYNE|nr:hypothetical protein [Candidatus Synechococcus calcipolaris]MDG2989487.1 hypothetical protein [Candidatus Synechococcus calcipolaris G9]
MTLYITQYTSDLGVVFDQVAINTVLIIDGARQSSEYNFEQPFLPDVWRSWCLLPEQLISSNREGQCSIPYSSIRRARLAIAADMFLEVPVPWRGNNDRFIQFFQAIAANSSIIYTELTGDNIPQFFTKVWSQ